MIRMFGWSWQLSETFELYFSFCPSEIALPLKIYWGNDTAAIQVLFFTVRLDWNVSHELDDLKY